jgi:hypothetical protein
MRDSNKNVCWSSCKVPIFLVFSCILKKLEFSRYIFEKYSNVKFHENPYSGSRVIPRQRIHRRMDRRTDGEIDRTDRHEEAITRFSQLC